MAESQSPRKGSLTLLALVNQEWAHQGTLPSSRALQNSRGQEPPGTRIHHGESCQDMLELSEPPAHICRGTRDVQCPEGDQESPGGTGQGACCKQQPQA